MHIIFLLHYCMSGEQCQACSEPPTNAHEVKEVHGQCLAKHNKIIFHNEFLL